MSEQAGAPSATSSGANPGGKMARRRATGCRQIEFEQG